MQFMIQGSWGVIPVWLNELIPTQSRTIISGVVYQLGNILASFNAVLQTTIAETYNNNYGMVMAITAGITSISIIILVHISQETNVKFLTVK